MAVETDPLTPLGNGTTAARDEFADCGVIARRDDEVLLTGLATRWPPWVAFSGDDDEDDLDLVDTDAQSLLLGCVEIEPSEASAHLFAWCALVLATRRPTSCVRRCSMRTTPTSGTSASRRWA